MKKSGKKNSPSQNREYRSSLANREASRRSYDNRRTEIIEERKRLATISANAEVICSDAVLREEMRKLICQRRKERRLSISEGKVTLTRKGVLELKAMAGRQKKTMTQEHLQQLKKNRAGSQTFVGGVQSYGLNSKDLVSESKATVHIPKSKDGIAKLVTSVSEDRELYNAVVREMQRLARLENAGLPHAEIKRRAMERAVRNRSGYTVTEKVRAHMREFAKIGVAALMKNISYGGESHCIHEWANIRGITYTTLRNRLQRYPVEEALDPAFNAKYKSGEYKPDRSRAEKRFGRHGNGGQKSAKK